MHLHSVTPDEIKKWVMQNAYQMDNPGVLALQEQTSVIRDWNEEPYKSDLKFCLASPVEYASVVSNLGMAILYQEINQDGKHPTTSGVLCERAYFPEKKLLTRLEKKGWPLFSKETFVPLCNFEVLAFSSYYPLQYFNVPRMLEMSSIPAWAKDRDGSNAPIIMGGGISFFNPEPVSDFFDCFFIGEGEEKLLHVLQIAKECRTADGIDKEKYLYRLAKETDYMYVPSFYDVKYFSGFGVKSRTSKIPEAKPVIRRALANIYDIKPLTRTFVPVCDSADMSISSVEISRGKCASSSVVDTAEGLVGLGTITKSNHPYAQKGGSVRPIDCLDVVNYPAIEGERLLRIRTVKGNEIIVSKDHPVLINGEYVPAVQIKKGNLIGTIRHKDTSEIQDYKDVSDAEIRLVAALIADGTLATSKHSVLLSKKTPDPIKFVADQMSILGIKYSILSSEGDYRIYTKTFDSMEDSEILSPADREAVWQKSTIYRILTKWNLLSKKSGNKVFPQFVSLFSDRQVSILLNTLISFDGSICLVGGSRGFNLGSKSREQCLYIKNLLTRFGIVSKVPFDMNGGAYQVQIRNFTFDNLDLALEFFKPMMWQEDKWRTLFILNSQKDRNLLSVDVVPYKAWTYFEQLKKDLNLTWEKINEELISYPSTNNIPRKKSRTGERVSRAFILKAFNSKCFNKYVHSNSNVISMLSGDVYWDTVISVDETPSVPCTDITTECPVHSFNINGILVHNCSASCNFCEGSARTMPLRERPLDVSLKAFDDVHKETGCFDTTPYGFNLSDHSNIRAMLNYLAKDQDVKIQMSSQRIDMFTEDFASLAYATGNRSVTLAVEGGSERMRRAVNKNLTTQQILEAFEIAMKIGFNKVKIYMIANLPFERSEDIDGTPSQLTSEPSNGPMQYHEDDAVYLTFEDNTSLLVSKNYVFYKKLGETTADQLQTGDEIYVNEVLNKVKAIERREADLYGPEKNEEDSLVGLMKKLAARRDYWKQQHGGKETVLNWSFTPFTSKNQTPFEFASCMGGLTNRKTLTPAVEAARQLGFKFRVGTAADVSTVAQVMTLGDRRLNNVIYRAYKEGIIQYFGGMGIGKDVLPAFENLLKEEVGHTYDVYGGEKMLHQIFPWDFIDTGMDKTHLKERYLQAKAATNSPFSCFNLCVSCGGCMVSQENLPQDAYMDVEKQFETI